MSYKIQLFSPLSLPTALLSNSILFVSVLSLSPRRSSVGKLLREEEKEKATLPKLEGEEGNARRNGGRTREAINVVYEVDLKLGRRNLNLRQVNRELSPTHRNDE
jgi:hypothetical protein